MGHSARSPDGQRGRRHSGRVTAASHLTSSPATPGSPASLPPARPRDRLALAALLGGTAVLYLWNLTVNGTANSFYAASAWAGSRSWEALLFGSLDPSNSITVDKPPVSQWVMGLSARLFGFSSASILVPEALMGVATVALVYGAVARLSGRAGGLVAGTAMALTPVAVMMFRFDNPDAVMVLLMTAGAYATVRATTAASRRWLVLAGVAVGFAFLAKMLEGLMVLPALALVYVVAAPTTLRRRLRDLVVAAGAMAVSAGWYVVLTILWPASSRPYLAGSTDNSFMDLVLGYNGLARLEGHGGGAGHGDLTRSAGSSDVAHELAERFAHGGGSAGLAGVAPGPTRLFSGEFGVEISWLLPAALVALLVGLALRGRAPRTDPARAGLVLFGAWLVVDGLVLSFMKTDPHPYYSLAVAPPIAALVGLGAGICLRERRRVLAVVGCAAIVASAGGWSVVLVHRDPTWQSWLAPVVGASTLVAVVAVLVAGLGSRPGARTPVRRPAGRRTGVVAGTLVLVALAGVAAPAAYCAEVVATPHTGASPSADSVSESRSRTPHATGGVAASFGGTATASSLDRLLQGAGTRWSAAVSRSSVAADLELSSRTPVMAIGGFTGSDPAPTLAQFEDDVASGQVRYYLLASTGGRSGGSWTSGSGGETGTIQRWVQGHYGATRVAGYLVYDLSATRTAGGGTASTVSD